MTMNDLLADAFERIKHSVHQTVRDMGEAKLAERPGKDANSIAWLIWHLARVQDDHIAALIGQEQVWTSRGWAEKFDLPFDAAVIGYGMTSEEVGLVRAGADDLAGYYDAVHEVTLQYLKTLRAQAYADIVDDAWDPPVTRGARLISILNDDMQHAGQAAYVRGLIES